MSWKTEAIHCTSNPLHLYNRGVDGMTIFRSDADYVICVELIAENLPKYEVELLGYSLMPNHYHVSAIQQKACEVSLLMHDVWWKYARIFNKKYDRYGPLFAGRFHPKIVENDAGLLRLSHYIHLNPVSAGLASDPSQWPHSSYQDYLAPRIGSLVNPEPILELVGGREQYLRFLAEYNPNDPFSINAYLANRAH